MTNVSALAEGECLTDAPVTDTKLPDAFSDIANLNFVVKISERCNIACRYCYFFFHDDQTFNDHPAYATDATLGAFVDFVEAAIAERGLKTISVGLHGGEPLMVPIARVNAFCRALKDLEVRLGDVRIDISLQTNGMLIDERWADLLARYQIGCGISIDGNRNQNDANRIDKKGRGTYDRVIGGYNILVDAVRERGAPAPGFLCVINPEFDGAGILHHLAVELGCDNINFLTPDVHFDDPAVDEAYVAGIGTFLVSVFREWVRIDRRTLKIRFIEEIMRPLLSDAVAETAGQRLRDYRHLVTVSSDGELSPEDTIRTLADRFRNTGFTTTGSTVSDLFSSDIWDEIEHIRWARPDACSDCAWWGICKAGSPANRFSRVRGFANQSVFCAALKLVYAEVAAWLVERGADPADLQRRLRLASDESTSLERLP